MGDDKTLIYSRQEVIDEVTKFYAFLTTLHVPQSALHVPPPGGWPNITAESHVLFKKNDEVMALMRHLPYIERNDHATAHPVYPLTACVDYDGKFVRQQINFANETHQDLDLLSIEPDDEDEQVPSEVLCLASETSGADGCWFLLDTDLGVITFYDPMKGKRRKGTVITKHHYDDEILKAQKWRGHDTYRVKDFFDILTEQFRTLELMPLSMYDVLENRDGGDFSERVLATYKDCGWPDQEIFRKDECLARVKELNRERLESD